jgi:hypothetical protein
MLKKLASVLAIAAAFVLVTGTVARAEEKVLGPVQKIAMAPDAKTAVATLKDNASGQTVDITVIDQVTLDKFKDHRISVGDDIKCKFDKKDGKNVATFFKKPGGC